MSNNYKIPMAEVLEYAARKIIPTPDKWTQGSYARIGNGPDAPKVGWYDKRATCYCLSGAVRVATSRLYRADSWDPRIEPSTILSCVVDTLAQGGVYETGPAEFNDQPERTHAEVLDALEKTAERLRHEAEEEDRNVR